MAPSRRTQRAAKYPLLRGQNRGSYHEESSSMKNDASKAPAAGNADLDRLLRDFEQRKPRALSRLISKVENHAPERNAIIERIYAKTGHAHVIGITGPPGAGKSTLVNLLIAKYRAAGKQVAVLAIDPSSPF